MIFLADSVHDLDVGFDRRIFTRSELAEVRIAVGYRWNPEEREIKAPLLSLRDGKDNVIWAVELHEPAEGVKVTWKPIEPTLPDIDFGELGDEAESGASGDQ